MRRSLTLLLCCFAPLLAAAPLPLPDLLDSLQGAPAVQAASQRLQALQAQRQLRESERGWSLFASSSLGSYRDLDQTGVSQDDGSTSNQELIDDYISHDYQVGVRYPLLGSLQRRREALQVSQHDVQRQQFEIALRRAEQRLTLRTAYADWWRSQQEQRWCQALQPAARAAEQRLSERQRSGWLRASVAQEQRTAWQALTRQCQQGAEREQEARELLALLVEVPASAEPVSEALVAAPRPQTEWQARLAQHPRLAQRTDQLQQAQALRDSPWYDSVDSSFKLAQSYQDRNDYHKDGSGLVASLDFSAPFDLLDNGRARQRLGEANYQTAQAQLQAEQQALAIGLAQSLRAYRAALLELQQRQAQLPVLASAWRERQARSRVDGEDGLLAELADERDYYQAGLAQIAAWHGLWLREAELRLFGDDDADFRALLGDSRLFWSAPTPLAMADPAPAAPAWTQATYVWDSHRLLDSAQRAEQLQALRAAGMHAIYLGLDGGQLRQPAATRAALQALLAEAADKGLQVSLLLGDPQWITPAGRGELLSLLRQLQGLPFAGLHLDLEVEQLGWPVPGQRLRDWLATLRAVRKISPWPLQLSSHPRWFESSNAEVCVPCELPKLGVERVSLMLYSRNAARSSARLQAIVQRWPALQLRLAQSVEPSLPADESWAGSSPAALRQQVTAWQAALQTQGVAGVDWQDWQHFPR